MTMSNSNSSNGSNGKAMTVKDFDRRFTSAMVSLTNDMHRKMAENLYKGDWKNASLNYLLMRVHEEVRELQHELEVLALPSQKDSNRTEEEVREAARLEAADVANIVMMIHDNL